LGTAGKNSRQFLNISLGVATNRDEWVYDESVETLTQKVKYFFDTFDNEKIRWLQSDKKTATNDFVDRSINGQVNSNHIWLA